MISTIEVDSLFEKYPDLFNEFLGPFDIGKGWFELVDNVCYPLNEYSKIKLFSKIKILNVKKKFGILHIDHKGGDEVSSQMINFAERLSYTTCEECGNKGSLYSTNGTQFGKLATLCDKDALIKYKKIYDFTSILKPLA